MGGGARNGAAAVAARSPSLGSGAGAGAAAAEGGAERAECQGGVAQQCQQGRRRQELEPGRAQQRAPPGATEGLVRFNVEEYLSPPRFGAMAVWESRWTSAHLAGRLPYYHCAEALLVRERPFSCERGHFLLSLATDLLRNH